MVYLDELDSLLDKNITFRVKVQPNYGKALVWNLFMDKEFVKQIETAYITNEVWFCCSYLHEILI